MSSISSVFESLQKQAHFLSTLLDDALLEKRYVTYSGRVDIRNSSAEVERLALSLLTKDVSAYSSTPITNRVHFLQSQLEMCIKRNVLTALYGPGKSIPAIQNAIKMLQFLEVVLEPPPPKDPLKRPELDLSDLRADSLGYFRLGFLDKGVSSSSRASGSYFEIGAFPIDKSVQIFKILITWSASC